MKDYGSVEGIYAGARGLAPDHFGDALVAGLRAKGISANGCGM